MQVQGEEFPTVEKFMAKYRLDAPAALERKVFRSSQPHFFSEPTALKSLWIDLSLSASYLFRQKPVYTSHHLNSAVRDHRLWVCGWVTPLLSVLDP
jgi:hypothetical protein